MKNKIYWIIGAVVIIILLKSVGLFAVYMFADESYSTCIAKMNEKESAHFDCSANECEVGGDGRYYLWCDCASGYVYSNYECIPEEEECDPHTSKACRWGDVWWKDCYGNWNEVYDYCDGDETCENGQCIKESVGYTCSKSGGSNYFNRGTCINYYPDGGSDSITDECWTGTTLFEYYCKYDSYLEGEACAIDEYDCPNGCSNGKCNSEEEVTEIFKCSDNDGGKQYGIASQCKTTFPDGYSETYYDECWTETELWEYYCAGDIAFEGHACHVDMYNCLGGCSQGKCISEQETTEMYRCTDTDFGYEIYEKGTCSHTNGFYETMDDECFTEDEVMEFYCEFDEAMNGNVCHADFFYCEFGCQDGTCVIPEYNDFDINYPCIHKDIYYQVGMMLEMEDPGSGDIYFYECQLDGEWVKTKKAIQPEEWSCNVYNRKGSPKTHFNLVFANLGLEEGDFFQVIDYITSSLFSRDPFNSYSSKFNIYIVSPDLPHLSYDIIEQVMDSCEISKDNIYLTTIINSNSQGSQMNHEPFNGFIELYADGGTLKSGFGGDVGWVFVHEMGHLFSHLNDEYVYRFEREVSWVDKNCDSDLKDGACDLWSWTIGDCIKGCTNDYSYRSSNNSIMRDDTLKPHEFNEVSKRILSRKLRSISSFSLMALTYEKTPSLYITIDWDYSGLEISKAEPYEFEAIPIQTEGEYLLRSLSDTDEVLYGTHFSINKYISGEAPPGTFDDEGNQITFPSVKTLNQGKISLIIPYIKGTIKLEILKDGRLITSYDIPFRTGATISPSVDIGKWILENQFAIFVITVLIVGYIILTQKRRR